MRKATKAYKTAFCGVALAAGTGAALFVLRSPGTPGAQAASPISETLSIPGPAASTLVYSDSHQPVIRKAPDSAPRLSIPARKALQPAQFKTPNGMRGWCLKLDAQRPLATPAVADGKVYFGGGFGSYEFYALDAITGKLAWSIKTTDDGPTAAVVEDDIVIYNTESCTVEAVDTRSGKRLWHRWLGDPLMSQPAVANGKIYMAYPGNDGKHYLIGLALKTGKTLWQSAINGDAISAPIVQDDRVYLATLDGALYCYSTASGKLQWQSTLNVTSAPWLKDGELYTTTRETNVGGVPVPPGSTVEDARAKLPKYPGQDINAAPVEHYENFVRINAQGKIVSRSPMQRAAQYLSASDNARKASGAKAKNYDAGVGFGQAPGTAKIGQAQANLGANTVSEVWAYQGSRPALVGNRSFNAQNEVLQCLDARRGRALWQLYLPLDVHSARTITPPSVAGDKLFFGTSRGEIGCARQSDGQLLWLYNIGSPIPFQPAVVRGRVYFGTENGSVFCIDTRERSSTGWAMWGGNAAHNGWTKS